MSKTKIEWTDETWNPVTGCTKVSSGCKNCYAERQWPRFHGRQVIKQVLQFQGEEHPVGERQRKFTDVQCHTERLVTPLFWRKPRRVFVNSMSDLFHDAVPDGFIHQVFAVMAMCPQHMFQILTKRPKRMMDICSQYQKDSDQNHLAEDTNDVVYWPFIANSDRDHALQIRWPLKNIWLGVSAEDKATYQNRVLYLARTPSAVRFVSFEPLLDDVGDLMLDGVFEGAFQWAIVGGESGPKARPMNPDHLCALRDQCVAAGVPFFFKQWGEWSPWDFDSWDPGKVPARGITQFGPENYVYRVGKKKAGRVLDGRTWDEFPA